MAADLLGFHLFKFAHIRIGITYWAIINLNAQISQESVGWCLASCREDYQGKQLVLLAVGWKGLIIGGN